MDLYADNVLDHYRHPHHKTPITGATITHTEKNLSCGDTVTLSLRITDDKVTAIGWEGDGCAISQAAMSMLADELIGKTGEELDATTAKDINSLLGIPIGNRRIKCALLCLHTLRNALHTMRQEEPQSWAETVGHD